MTSFTSPFRAKKRSRSLELAEQELLDALKESRNLLNIASAQAERIVQEAGTISDEIKRKVEKDVTAATGLVKEQLQDYVNHIIEQGKVAQKEVLEEAKRTMENHADAVDAEMVAAAKESHQQLEEGIQDARARAEKLLAEFMESEQKRLAQKLVEQLPQVIKETTGQAITLDDHQRLVRAALKRIAQDILPS